MVEFNITEEKVLSWRHFTVTDNGKIHVFFTDNHHETLDRDQLEGTGEANLVALTGQVVKLAAEQRQVDSTKDITTQDIADEFTAKHDALKEAENPIEEK